MGNYSSCCGSKAKKNVIDIKKDMKKGNEISNSRQTQDTFTESTYHKDDTHTHANDFILNTPNILSEFEFQDELGIGTNSFLKMPITKTGSYGRVVRAVNKKTQQARAIKIVAKNTISRKDKTQLMEEVRLLSLLVQDYRYVNRLTNFPQDHPNIVKLYGFLEDEKNYYIGSELLTGGELFDRILKSDHISEYVAADIMRQVLSAVAYCHKRGVVHRDLKPENILFDTMTDDTIKVIDFGLAQVFKNKQRMHGVIGTAYYIAPEILNDEDYTEKCDLWSCGVILYIMLSGYSPFEGQKSQEIFEEVKRGDFDFDKPIWNTISHSAIKLIKRMMEYDPAKRISAEEALHDPWFTEQLKTKRQNKPLASDVLQRLHTFRAGNKFQEAMWVYLVKYFSSKNELHKLNEAFRLLDHDNDGQLSKAEMKAAYIQNMGMTEDVAEQEAEKIFKELDYDHDGKINYSEFISAASSRKMMLTKEKLDAAFAMIDRDHDGKIKAEELKNLFSEERIRMLPSNTWNEWIEQVAQNKDGTVTSEQFSKMMWSIYGNGDPSTITD